MQFSLHSLFLSFTETWCQLPFTTVLILLFNSGAKMVFYANITIKIGKVNDRIRGPHIPRSGREHSLCGNELSCVFNMQTPDLLHSLTWSGLCLGIWVSVLKINFIVQSVGMDERDRDGWTEFQMKSNGHLWQNDGKRNGKGDMGARTLQKWDL